MSRRNKSENSISLGHVSVTINAESFERKLEDAVQRMILNGKVERQWNEQLREAETELRAIDKEIGLINRQIHLARTVSDKQHAASELKRLRNDRDAQRQKLVELQDRLDQLRGVVVDAMSRKVDEDSGK